MKWPQEACETKAVERAVSRSVVAVFLAAAAGSAAAFHPLITDDTGTQGKGGNQLEGGYARTTDELAGAKDVSRGTPLVYTRGVADELDLYAGFTHLRHAPVGAARERGWSNPALGAKWRFFEDETSKLSFAVKPELQLPLSNGQEARGLGTARASYALGLLMTKETGFGAVHVNLAVNRVNYGDGALNDAERRTQYRLSAAPVWDVTEQWKLALDVGVMSNPDREMKSHMGYVELGTIYSHSKDLDFALGAIQGTSDGPVKSTQWTAGLTWRFQ